MKIDLNTCKPGDKLKTKHGKIVTYKGKEENWNYPHLIEFDDGSQGTRLDNGQVFASNRLPADEDIVEILH